MRRTRSPEYASGGLAANVAPLVCRGAVLESAHGFHTRVDSRRGTGRPRHHVGTTAEEWSPSGSLGQFSVRIDEPHELVEKLVEGRVPAVGGHLLIAHQHGHAE